MYKALSCIINVDIDKEFENDTNAQLLDSQKSFDIWRFIWYFASKYIDACDLVGKQGIIYHQIDAKTSVRTNLFINAYRIICANYRIIASTQRMPLIESDCVYVSLSRSHWEKFYNDEMNSLSRDPHINQTVIFMLARDGEDVATYAENILLKLLMNRYVSRDRTLLSVCPQFQRFFNFSKPSHREWPYSFQNSFFASSLEADES